MIEYTEEVFQIYVLMHCVVYNWPCTYMYTDKSKVYV